MTTRPLFHGVITPIVTPLTRRGDVDEPSLRRLVEFQVSAGVTGLFALGTGGEGPWTVAPTRRRVLEVVVDQSSGRVPVFAGVSDVGTDRALESVSDAECAGCQAVVATPAFYGDNGQAEILAHFRAIKDRTSLPLAAYDIPSKVGQKIAGETTSILAHEGTIVALKDSSGDEDTFRGVIDATQDVPGFAVITGSDMVADAALFQGAHGMIVGMGNIDPHGFVRLYQAFQDDKLDTARTEQTRLRGLRAVALVGLPRIGAFSSTIAGFKAAMVHRRIIATDVMHRPLLQLTDDERRTVVQILSGFHLGPAFADALDGA